MIICNSYKDLLTSLTDTIHTFEIQVGNLERAIDGLDQSRTRKATFFLVGKFAAGSYARSKRFKAQQEMSHNYESVWNLDKDTSMSKSKFRFKISSIIDYCSMHFKLFLQIF